MLNIATSGEYRVAALAQSCNPLNVNVYNIKTAQHKISFVTVSYCGNLDVSTSVLN